MKKQSLIILFLFLLFAGVATAIGISSKQKCLTLESTSSKLKCIAKIRDTKIQKINSLVAKKCKSWIKPEEKVACFEKQIIKICGSHIKNKEKCLGLIKLEYPNFPKYCSRFSKTQSKKNCLKDSKDLEVRWKLVTRNYWIDKKKCGTKKYVSNCIDVARRSRLKEKFYIHQSEKCFRADTQKSRSVCLGLYRKKSKLSLPLDISKNPNEQCLKINNEQLLCRDGSLFQLVNEVDPVQLESSLKMGDGDRGG